MATFGIAARFGAADVAPIGWAEASRQAEFEIFPRRPRAGEGINLTHLWRRFRKLGLRPSEVGLDLLTLAVMVYAADTRVSRGTHAEDGWTRQLELHVPVSDPERWGTQAELIKRMLDFLSGDRWTVRFRQRLIAREVLVPDIPRILTYEPDGVCLFSGGLDSFIGAIDLLSDGRRPLLVGHSKAKDVSEPQSAAANYLAAKYRKSPPAYLKSVVRISKTLLPWGQEDTERSRSFLFFAIAVAAATALADELPVYVPENGFISLNVPLTKLRLGALSTRTTHPHYMALYNQLLEGLGLGHRLVNPYQFATKGEMVRDCLDAKVLKGFAARTKSCAHPGRHKGRHCGYCVPCIIRRASVEAAYGRGKDGTAYVLPNLHARPLDGTKAEGAQIQAFQVALAELAARPQEARQWIRKPGPLPADDGPFLRVFDQGMAEVRALLAGVVVQYPD